jgi:hypothetical protein
VLFHPEQVEGGCNGAKVGVGPGVQVGQGVDVGPGVHVALGVSVMYTNGRVGTTSMSESTYCSPGMSK